MPGLELADVGFADARVDLHLAEIFGDREERRRLQRGRDGLADVDAARDDRAVGGRNDRGVVEVDLRLMQVGVRLRQPPCGDRRPAPSARVGGRLGGVEVVPARSGSARRSARRAR